MAHGLSSAAPSVFISGAPRPVITKARREDRDGDELIGICRGLIADGGVNQQEAKYLLGWIDRHLEFCEKAPFSIVYRRVADALKNGALDGDEERDLLAAVHGLVGGESDDQVSSLSLSTQLPFDAPPPDITFQEHSFVVTGVFTYGSRRKVVNAITNAGGTVRTDISKLVNYLIVGEVGSRDWIHSSFGRKIESALELKESGTLIAIVSEARWQASLKTS